jgi:hypothetical protein
MQDKAENYKKLYTSFTINAPAEKVMQVILDFESYPHWNPLVKAIQGKASVGEKLQVLIQPQNQSGMKLSPKVLISEPLHFAWRGNLIVPGLFDGEHHFEVIKLSDNSCQLNHYENFSGILIPLFRKMLEVDTYQSFKLLNQALKERVEAV